MKRYLGVGLIFCLFVSILLVLSVAKKPRLSDSYYQTKARKYHDDAINLANDGDYRMALALFRASVRLDPKNANYWSDLGVTEMRMGQLLKAKKRFFKALEIDTNNKFAIDNLRELAEFLKENPDDYFKKNGELTQFKASKKPSNRNNLRDRRQHSISEPRILTKDEFLLILEESYGTSNHSFTTNQKELLSKPFVVRSFLSSSKESADSKVFDYFHIDSLQQKFTQQRVDYYPHNMQEESAKPYFNTLDVAIDDLMAIPEHYYVDVDASEGGTYIQWNLDASLYRTILHDAKLTLPRFFDIKEDLNVFSCLGEQLTSKEGIATDDLYRLLSEFYLKVHWKMLIIGEANAGMFFHQDILQASAWQLLLSGEKKWHICPGKQTTGKKSGRSSELANSHSLNDLYYKAGDIDMFDYYINYQRYPKLKQATCYETTLYPGDFLYYPGDYWHQTLNLQKPTMALSSSVLFSKYDFEVITRELRQECYGSPRIFKPNPLLCSRLEKCFETWGTAHIGIAGEGSVAGDDVEEDFVEEEEEEESHDDHEEF